MLKSSKMNSSYRSSDFNSFDPIRKRCSNCGDKNHSSQSCLHKQPKCFQCNEFGHISMHCPNKSTSIKQNENIPENMLFTINKKGCIKSVIINDQLFTVLIDTGSNKNVISSSVFLKIGITAFDGGPITFQGFGNSSVTSFGSITLSLKVDDENYVSVFHVVSDSDSPYDKVVGREMLAQSILIVDGCEAQIFKKNKEDEEIEQIMNIDVMDEISDLSHITNHEIKNAVIELIKNYTPMKCKDTQIQTKIVLIDKKPIYTTSKISNF